jgi:hypothetical protein
MNRAHDFGSAMVDLRFRSGPRQAGLDEGLDLGPRSYGEDPWLNVVSRWPAGNQ